MYSPITGVGAGSAPVVNLTFDYISRDHVKASVDGVAVGISWTGASQVTFDAVVAAGQDWAVFRETPIDEPLVDFEDTSVLTAADLDLQDQQLRFHQEEVDQRVASSADALESAAAADASADASSASATASAASATASAASATAAAGSAATSTTKAGEAAASALSAAASATAADASADAADTSADTATAALAAIGSVPNAAHSVSTRTALASAVLSTAFPAYLTEAGREGEFVWNGSDLSALVAADTAQGLYVAPAAAPTGASGAWVRKFSGRANVKWFGAVGDDVTNDGPAFVAALAALHASKMTGTQYGYGRGSLGLFIPASTKPYYLGTSTLDVTHTLIIEGENGAGPSGGSTVLRWADNTTGIRLQSYNTSGGSGGPVVTTHQGAAQTLIRNLMLIGGFTGTESESHGIHLRVGATIRDVLIAKFGGDGIYANTAALSVTNAGNSNGSTVENVFIQECRTGIYIEEFDANAWTLITPHTSINRRYGIWTKNTLGGSIFGGLAETNGLTPGFPTQTSSSGNRYVLLPSGNPANAPSGTTANTADWAYREAGGATSDIPAWSAGIGARGGGAMRIEGNFQAWTVTGWYFEPGQSWPFISDAAATVWLSPMGGYPRSFDGTVSGHGLFANGAGVHVARSFRVGRTDLGVPLSAASLSVDGDTYLTRTGVDYSPSLFINATGPGQGGYIRFWHDGGGNTLLLGLNGDLYYQTDTNTDQHIFNVGSGNTIATITNTGLSVTGSLAATNLSGTNTGDQFTNTTASRVLGRGSAGGAGAAQELTLAGGLEVSGTALRVGFSATSKLLGRSTAGAGAGEEIGLAGGLSITGGNLTVTGGALAPASVAATGAITSSGGGVGYATGAGGTVAQPTSKATGVTLNKLAGEITTNAAALAANTAVTFVLTNSQIAAGDRIIVNHMSGGTFGAYIADARSAAGSATFMLRNLTAGSLSEAVVLGFTVIKSVTA